jgi:N-acetyltransferase 10
VTDFALNLADKLANLCQTTSDLTGEHTAVMLRALDTTGLEEAPSADWLSAFAGDALRRVVSLMAFEFRGLDTAVHLAIVENLRSALPPPGEGGVITARQIGFVLTPTDLEVRGARWDGASTWCIVLLWVVLVMLPVRGSLALSRFWCLVCLIDWCVSPRRILAGQRLRAYVQNLVDYHLITDLLPTLARLYFLRYLPADVRLSHLMEAILLGLGLLHRGVDGLSRELGVAPEQLLAMFNKVVRKITGAIRGIQEREEKTAQVASLPAPAPAPAPAVEGKGEKGKKRKREGLKGESGPAPVEEEVMPPVAVDALEEEEQGEKKKKKKKKKKKTSAEVPEEASQGTGEEAEAMVTDGAGAADAGAEGGEGVRKKKKKKSHKSKFKNLAL